jgi:hypothetical protein
MRRKYHDARGGAISIYGVLYCSTDLIPKNGHLRGRTGLPVCTTCSQLRRFDRALLTAPSISIPVERDEAGLERNGGSTLSERLAGSIVTGSKSMSTLRAERRHYVC